MVKLQAETKHPPLLNIIGYSVREMLVVAPLLALAAAAPKVPVVFLTEAG